jgi:hypothetical protein
MSLDCSVTDAPGLNRLQASGSRLQASGFRLQASGSTRVAMHYVPLVFRGQRNRMFFLKPEA